MKTLIFTNQKGGCGKTTCALSTGAALQRAGQRVLLVDTDPQGHLSKSAGIRPDEADATIYEVLKGRAAASDAIRTAPGGYDVLPADIRQAGIDIELASVPGRDVILSQALQKVSARYDFCIIDSPPNLGITTLMGLTAADGVIIVLKADFLALDGVAQLMDTITIVRQRLNPLLKITGVLITFYSSRKNIARQIEEMAQEGFPGLVFDTRITPSVALEEAPAFGVDIFQYKPASKAERPQSQFTALAAEIIGRI